MQAQSQSLKPPILQCPIFPAPIALLALDQTFNEIQFQPLNFGTEKL